MNPSFDISVSRNAKAPSTTAAGEPISAVALQQVYLHAGQTCASRDPLLLSMILGSCVAVCLFDHQLSIGGATHFLLPEWQHAEGQPSSRYGNVAIQVLIEQLKSLGCKTANLSAKIFGGACMFQSLRDAPHIGSRNAAIAAELLREFSLPVIAKDVGGERGRKIRMWTNTGEVVVELVGS